jgi:hypothetical protein
LKGRCFGHSGEFRFVLEVCEGDFLGVVDHAVHFEEVLVCIDFGDTAVVADEEVFVRSNFGLGLLVCASKWCF